MDESKMTDLLKSVRSDLEALVDAGLTEKQVLAEFDEACHSCDNSSESGDCTQGDNTRSGGPERPA
jgi:hypothetical protein